LDNRATAEIEEQLREERRDAEARRKRVKLGDVAHDAAASADVDVAPDEEADAAGAAKDDSANTSSDEAFAAVVAANEADDATAEAASVAQQQAADYWKEVMVMARASQFPPPPGIAQMLGAMSNQAAIAEKLPVDEAAAGVSATTEPPLDLTIGKPTPPEEREIFEGRGCKGDVWVQCNIRGIHRIRKNAPPVVNQLWPHVSKIIAQAETMMAPLLTMIGVKRDEMSPFCKEFESPKDLLRIYISFCPRTFSYEGRIGEGEDEGITGAGAEGNGSDTQGEGSNQAMADKIRHFVNDILADHKAVDGEVNAESDDEVAVVEKANHTSEKRKRTKKKVADPQKLLLAVQSLLRSKETDELLDKALLASAALESSDAGRERGSASRDRKAKSLLGRLYGKGDRSNTGDIGDADGSAIERNTVVSSLMKVDRGKQKTEKLYRVLGLYDKSYNKWWMSGEEKHWTESMKDEEKKKYKLAVRMLQDGVLEDYDDVPLTSELYNRKEICKLIDGSQVTAVKGKLTTSVV